ncbi:MAG TPA: four helix bundle protein [Herpetosiphonaceae bacterium]
MAKNYTYRNLIVWQRAQQLALQIMGLVQQVPQSWANAVIVRQIISAATSIGANIAEGHGRYMPGAHRNHLSIARGSTAETDSWLDLLHRAGWITFEEEAVLHAECLEIMAILTSKMLDLDRMKHDTDPHIREDLSEYKVHEAHDQPLFPFTDSDYHTDQ